MARYRITPLAWRLGFLYAALFVVVGFYLPYMPVWLHWRSLSEDEIAFLLAAPLFARILFTPIISFAADCSGARRAVLIALAWGTLLSFLLLWASGGFWQMLLATLLLAFNWTTIMPLIEAMAVSGVRSAGLDYGRVRLWGSGSFILASFGAGLVIGQLGAASVMPMLVGATVLMIAGVYLLPRDVAERPATPAHRRVSLADAVKLAHSPSFLLFLLAASAIQASHALYYSFGTLHWRAQGFADGTIGALWALGVAAEIVLFAVSGSILARWGAPRMLMAAGAAAALRWGIMAFDPPLWATAMAQCLHAMSFGAAHLAAIYFLSQAVPEGHGATAQGVYAAVVAGLVLGLVTIASGPLYQGLAGDAYGVMALLALVGAASAVLLMRRWRGERVVGPIQVQPQSAAGGGVTVPEV
ncbi:MAG TPA: MFS transporter [Methyloceanibacter sp.]|nr:MFS transporter [Methyloceanibacter sp.]